MEKWITIPGHNDYQVSDHGRVMSLKGKTPRYLKPTLTHNGYYRVCLDGEYCRVNRLVWEVFNGPIPDGMQVNHINEIKTDNRLENLNLLTNQENSVWGTRMDKFKKWVIKLTPNNEILHFYQGVREAEIETGIDHSQISRCCKGKCSTAGGYLWKHAA